jgi:hypothetical protein
VLLKLMNIVPANRSLLLEAGSNRTSLTGYKTACQSMCVFVVYNSHSWWSRRGIVGVRRPLLRPAEHDQLLPRALR